MLVRVGSKNTKFSQAGGVSLAVLLSLILHAVILALVFWGWDSAPSKPKKRMPTHVQAKLVQIKPQTLEKKAPKQVSKKPKVIDLTKKKEQERKAAEEKRRKAAQKKTEEQKRLAEKKRKEAERKKALKRKQEQERKQKEAAEKARKEKARKEKEALQESIRQQEREAQERELAEELAQAEAEEKAILAEQEAEAIAQSYVSVIAARIERFWSRPPSARKGMQCELLINLVPTGRVTSVTIVKSSGNDAFDRSAEQAVLKAEQFAELKQVKPAVFEKHFRQLRLIFNPQDLRL